MPMPTTRMRPIPRRPGEAGWSLSLSLSRALVVLACLTLAACGATTRRAPSPVGHDPHTRQALLQIARRFNDDYAANRSGAVYDRWDARSRAIISRADYIRRHRECSTAPGPATVEDAVAAGGWWLVHYSISGTQLTDYWSYQHGRWTFDLPRSNPQAVGLYRLPARRYLAAVGCS
jgi:hypothetical protein